MTIDRRYWPWGILLLGVMVFVILVLTRPRQQAPEIQPRVWQVEAIAVQPRRLSPVLTLYGKVEAPALMRATAPAASQVIEVRVREGQEVAAGQLLVRLDPRDFKPQVLEAEAEIAELEAQLELERLRHGSDMQALKHEEQLLQLLQNQLVRVEKLRKRGLGSEAALDQARMEVARQRKAVVDRRLAVQQHQARQLQLQARLEKARARLVRAQLALERSRVIAPFAGVVAEVGVAMGDRVGQNQLLVSLFSWQDLEVRARIPAPFQSEIHRSLERGDLLDAKGESLGMRFRLQLARLAGQAEAGGIDALFRVTEGARQLRMNLPVTVQLQRPAKDHVVAVPYAALYGSRRLYRIVAGRLQSVEVTPLGDYPKNGQTWLLVQSPELRAGDQILVTHLPNAADGLAVEARLIGEVS